MPAGAIGHRVWAIAEGYIPPVSTGTTRELVSHETVCILNAASEPAHVEITVYFADRAPVGPYRFTVEAQRTRHLRFNDFTEPEPVPKGTDFSSVIASDVPVVVQHTRLDTRQPALALLSTMAHPVD
ncbi:MAG: sensory rhodopsin transducer [Alphaproteobacteria bacterium]